MRSSCNPLLVGVICLSALTVPTASAQTTTEPPERPPVGVPFVDNPAIVDSHPVPVESWGRLPDERRIVVSFVTGTPACFGVHATAQETPESVTVELRGGTLPEAVGRPCIMIALTGTVEVPLAQPLGGRRVLSVT